MIWHLASACCLCMFCGRAYWINSGCLRPGFYTWTTLCFAPYPTRGQGHSNWGTMCILDTQYRRSLHLEINVHATTVLPLFIRLEPKMVTLILLWCSLQIAQWIRTILYALVSLQSSINQPYYHALSFEFHIIINFYW